MLNIIKTKLKYTFLSCRLNSITRKLHARIQSRRMADTQSHFLTTDNQKIWNLLKWFVEDSLGSIEMVNREHWDSWEIMDQSIFAKRRCGYDLLSQITFKSHMKLVEAVEEKGYTKKRASVALQMPRTKVFAAIDDRLEKNETPRRVLAPETMAVERDVPNFDTVTIVPETETLEYKFDAVTQDAKVRPRHQRLAVTPSPKAKGGQSPSKKGFVSGPSPKIRSECQEGKFDPEQSNEIPLLLAQKADKSRKCIAKNRIKKKKMRILKDHQCAKCFELYDTFNMNLAQLKEVVASCHDGRFKEEKKSSPQHLWDLDLRDEKESDKTQIGSPLLTRKLRREQRNQKSILNLESETISFK